MLIEMELSKIIIDEKRHDQVIVLKEKSGSRVLPIIIGIFEASAIKIRLSKDLPPRPQTHDLLRDVITGLGAALERVLIDKLENNTFHAKLVLVRDDVSTVVDARPSDSIALAVRMNAPLFVDEEVLRQTEHLNQGPA
jgi:hypothetical protein